MPDLPYRGGGAALWTALALLVFAPLLAFLVRRRWRIAAARAEEVKRLLRLAAAETARAEFESSREYLASSLPDPGATDGVVGAAAASVCAECGHPTKTRCSRCKAVRYCSGRCQIAHWRKGHKDNCHPPPTGVEIEGELHAKTDERCSDVPSSESFSSEAFSEDDNHGARPSVGASGTDSTSDSSADSSSMSSCSPVRELLEKSVDASALLPMDNTNMENHPHHPVVFPEDPIEEVGGSTRDPSPGMPAKGASSDKPSCSPVRELLEKSVDASALLPMDNTNMEKHPHHPVVFPEDPIEEVGGSTRDPSPGMPANGASSDKPEDTGRMSSGPVDSSFFSDNDETAESPKKASECQEEVLESIGVPYSDVVNTTDFQFPEKSGRVVPDASKTITQPTSGKESTYRASPVEESSNSDLKNTLTLSSNKSAVVADGKNNGVLLRQPEGLKLQSSAPCTDHGLTSSGQSTVSSDASSNRDDARIVQSLSSGGTGSVSNGISDLKTSVRKVVEQFKSKPTLRRYPSMLSSNISSKYKMLFPYDLFVKLYNCDKIELRPCGLTNCGNSCYANAVLQCLAFTRPLTAYLLQGHHSKTCPQKDWCITCEFQSLLMKAKGGHTPLSPIGILSHLHDIGSHLGHGREEDAHEFLRCAIDAMQSVCLKEAGANAVGPLAEETTLIQLIFGGYLLSKIKCMRCQGKSEQRERMMDLTVEIQGDIGTLEEALTRFTATEILDGENKYHCSRCKSYERAKKKLTVLEAPNVLTIALKRFQSGKFGKLNKAVRFPENLNLAPYMSGTDDKFPVYRLYAVVVHLDVMNAAFSGHYVCYVKSTHKKWYKIDDSKVKPVEFENVLSKNAYMLLYARCSPRAPSVARKITPHEHVMLKRSKSKQAGQSGHSGEGGHVLRAATNSPVAEDRGHNYWSAEHSTNLHPSDLLEERFRFQSMETSSDGSSLLSCSDEGSLSTESTRNSTSTEELTAYGFEDLGHFGFNSLPFSDDSDGFTYSPSFSRHASEAAPNRHRSNATNSGTWASGLSSSGREDADGEACLNYEDWRPSKSKKFSEDEERRPFLYHESTDQCRKLTEECRSRETDRPNPQEVKSGLLLRRSTRERTEQ